MMNSADTALMRLSDVLVAGALLTRLPLPHAPHAAFDRQARAGWAYPLVGAALGGLAGCVWLLAAWVGLPVMVQAGLALTALALMTGALHEDGLADTADGLWGGHDPARRLAIMKDSHIGSYGVLALVFGVGLRWFAFAAAGPWALVVGASVSRGTLPALLCALPSARADGLAHSVGAPPRATALLALAIGAGLGCAVYGMLALAAIFVACLVTAGLGLLAYRKIKGVTGDICGAAQILAELAVLLVLIP